MTWGTVPLPSMRCHWPQSCARGIVHPGPCEEEELELSPTELWREHVRLDYGEHRVRDWNENVLKIPAQTDDT